MIRKLALCSVILLCSNAFAQSSAKVYSFTGAVEARKGASGAWQPAVKDSELGMGDALRTGDASKAAYVNSDGILVRLNSNSLVEFPGGDGSVKVAVGDAYFLSRDPHEMPSVTTTLVSGSVRGTEFAVSVRPNEVTFSVMNGTVDLKNKHGAVVLQAGEQGVTEPGKAPVKRIMVRPFDAVMWSLRFPALLSLAEFKPALLSRSPHFEALLSSIKSKEWGEAERSSGALSGNDGAIARAILSYSQKGPHAALKELEHVAYPDQVATLLQSGLLLDAGEVESARSAMAGYSATSHQPELSAYGSSIQSILALVGNDKVQARALAKEARKLSATSVLATYVESVGAQADGEIALALELTRDALESDPENPYLLSREAELLFGSGKTEDAAEQVGKALALAPNDSDSLSIKGFILLARGEIEEARSTFTDALGKFGTLASAHLGLGISELRLGNEESGRKAIQKAVHLEPTNALYRSYLAKAFFETERYDTASEELENAKRLDPMDPTPDLYDAFNKLATYRPVDALGAVEDSIAKNDNRFVFRSKLLLDQDRATRAVGLGRVFNALDFFTPAKIAAQRALAEDPTNYSAHFLLKDSLSGDPSAENALGVEDSTAGLLAPSTFSSILATAGSSTSLNDYTTLFEQEQGRTIVDFIGRSKERGFNSALTHFWGGKNESVLVNYSASVQQGFRDNDYQRVHSTRMVGAYDVSSTDKILVDGIFALREQGDVLLGFNPLTNDPDLDFDLRNFTGKMGYRHSFSAGSHLIGQFAYLDSRQKFSNLGASRTLFLEQSDGDTVLDTGSVDLITDGRDRTSGRGFQGDIQHLYNSDYLSLTSGASFISLHQRDTSLAVERPLPEQNVEPFTFDSAASTDPLALRGYSYLTLKPTSWLRLSGGSNYSSIDAALPATSPVYGDEYRNAQWSPRLGMMVYPSDSVTIRSAYFHSSGRASALEFDPLEPTQIGGIRTVFNDDSAQRSENFGVGVDWKRPKDLYIGFEFLNRMLTSPSVFAGDVLDLDISGTQSLRSDFASSQSYSQQHSATAYVNKVLSKSWVSSLEHTWSLRDSSGTDLSIATNKTRLGLNYYHPSGFFTFGSGTWRHQTRKNYFEADTRGVSAFWIFTAGAGWQLPDRHGSVQLVARNIFDESFTYDQPNDDLQILPGSDIQLAVNFNF